MAAIARVEPLTTARALRGPFDYRIPSAMAGIEVGTMLVVPFGRRRVLGVVVDLASESAVPPERLVEPLEALESGVPAELVRLGLWIADEYCSTPARGLALVLPPGTGTASRGAPAARTRTLLAARLTASGTAALDPGSGVRLGARQRAALEALRAGPATLAELADATGADHAAVRRLAERGLVLLERRAVRRRPAAVERGSPGLAPTTAREPSPAQRDALAALVTALERRRHERFLLNGVTGSGKTEVYLGAAAAALEQGRSAIVLVPEIALTPQIARRFEERFGEGVAILHSKLGLGERYDEWQRLRSGVARLCVGPRSALFAPLRDVGLIVLDEEHDSAYKQESDPRYDARHVAARRAVEAGAVLVLGSATPRAESWIRTRRLDLPQRVDGLALPPVELVDMRDVHSALHRSTREALDEIRRRRSKAIVLVNRRGWSAFLVCRSCGRTWICPRCDVTLTLHRDGDDQRLRCHHCGHHEGTPSTCPDCRSTAVARHGTGSQRLEVELRQALDPLPVFRLDADSAQRKNATAELLASFERADCGILVGTQMVAQGHDFPEVELAVVQDADATLRFPDFRAEERTFSLVAQLAGRSGRGPRGGRVLVQTVCPEAACLCHAARHDAGAFVEEELRRRSALGYPPYVELAQVVTGAGSQEHADAAATKVAEAIAAAGASKGEHGLQVLGPAPLFRVKDRYRARLVVKSTDRAAIVAALRNAVARASGERRSREISFAVDIDPH